MQAAFALRSMPAALSGVLNVSLRCTTLSASSIVRCRSDGGPKDYEAQVLEIVTNALLLSGVTGGAGGLWG
jgi:hypothetical protein